MSKKIKMKKKTLKKMVKKLLKKELRSLWAKGKDELQGKPALIAGKRKKGKKKKKLKKKCCKSYKKGKRCSNCPL